MSSPGKRTVHFLRCRLVWDESRTQTIAREVQALAWHAAELQRLMRLEVYEGFTTRGLANLSVLSRRR